MPDSTLDLPILLSLTIRKHLFARCYPYPKHDNRIGHFRTYEEKNGDFENNKVFVSRMFELDFYNLTGVFSPFTDLGARVRT